ncbi:MAG: hypothetical protein KDD94_12950 [Calditrichaeota bacterium]|nr:hypothetical protein [Calditrichota bacterium]
MFLIDSAILIVYELGIIALFRLEEVIGLTVLGLVVVFPILFQYLLQHKVPLMSATVLCFFILLIGSFYQLISPSFDLITICLFPFTQWVGLLANKYVLS